MKQIFILFLLSFFTQVYGQNYTTLKKVLLQEFSNKQQEDGLWTSTADTSGILKIDKPLVNALVPTYDFFAVKFRVHVRGYEEIYNMRCLIVFDSSTSHIIDVKPLWFADISAPLIKLFLHKPFKDEESLLHFMNQLNELLEIGSGDKFFFTGYKNNILTYDFVRFNGREEIPVPANMTYTNKDIWRKIRIHVKDLQLMEYSHINPRFHNEEVTIK